MKQDKETKAKLLASARAEFLEKGYMKASLRNICKNANVTTGALYFFFEDKDDLFCSLVKDTVDGIRSVMLMHFQEEALLAQSGNLNKLGNDTDDLNVAIQAIHQMYQHRDDVLLILTKSQGSSLEHVLDQFIDISEKHLATMAREIQRHKPNVVIDHNTIHWLAHMQIDAFVFMITHIDNEQDAIRYMTQEITFMLAGWDGMLKTMDWR